MSRKFYWISNCRSQDCSKVRCSSSKPERYKSVEMYTIPVKSGFFRRMWFFIRLLSCCFCAFTLPHECTTHLIAPLEVCPMHSTLGYCTLLFNLLLELGSVCSAPVFFFFCLLKCSTWLGRHSVSFISYCSQSHCLSGTNNWQGMFFTTTSVSLDNNVSVIIGWNTVSRCFLLGSLQDIN